jgi:cytochrome c oxidase subunit 1/cytochrome c oxidase subunit I+III
MAISTPAKRQPGQQSSTGGDERGETTSPNSAQQGLFSRGSETLAKLWQAPDAAASWFTAVNHRTIGKRYVVTGFIFFLLAGIAALLMRIQLAFPQSTFLNADQYNQLFTMHGTTMMFLFAVPIMEGVGIYLVPLMLGTRDMVFPRLNAFGYYVYLIAGSLIWLSLFLGNAPDGGWFAYAPLSEGRYAPGIGIDLYATLISFLEIAALVAAVELIVTILTQRAQGMTINRMPLFVWSILVMAGMIIFAMPSVIVASVALALDRTVNAQFFDPNAGGDPLLWQHLFWFFGHPEVYIIFVPALGIVAEVLPTFVRRPIVGYPLLVLSLVAIGILSFGLWVHHMFTTGLPEVGLSFFAVASTLIAIPSGIQIFAALATLMEGRLVVRTPLLYVLGFLITFVMGGITGVMVAAVPFDWQVHDSYFVVAHLHYVLIGGAVFPLFAGLYYWFPKFTGKMLDERLGRWNFWLTFIGFHVAFLPMHLTGLWGMPRRLYTYLPGMGWDLLNLVSTLGALLLGLGVAVFVANVVASARSGRQAPANPWGAATLEWATASPPPPYNFAPLPVVNSRYPLWEAEGPKEYEFASFDERREVLTTTIMEAQPEQRTTLPGPTIVPLLTALAVAFTIVSTLIWLWLVPIGMALIFVALAVWFWPSRRDRDMEYVKAGPPGALPVSAVISSMGGRPPYFYGMVLLIVIEAAVFAALISSFFYLAAGAESWPPGDMKPPELLLPTVNTLFLLASSGAMFVADRGIRKGNQRRLKIGYVVACLLAAVFLAGKVVEYVGIPGTVFKGVTYTWETNAYGSIVWTIIGYHSLHVLALLLKTLVIGVWGFQGYFNRERHAPVEVNGLYWHFVVLVWLPLYATLYLSPRLLGSE